jgi:hypothetical protein
MSEDSVMFPIRWIERLRGVSNGRTHQLAAAIWIETSKRGHIGGELTLSSLKFRSGVSPAALRLIQ